MSKVGIPREDLHELLDSALDAWGIKDTVPINYGRIAIEVQITDGKVELVARQRETIRTK